MKKDNFHLLLFGIFVLAVSILIRAVLMNIYIDTDTVEVYEYERIAKNIVAGKGYIFHYLGTTYRSFAAPLYAFLISFIYKFTGINVTPVIWFQIVLSLATCVVIFFIARRITGPWVSLLASLLCAFHPAFIIYSVKKIHSLSLDSLLFSLTVLSVIKLRENLSLKNAALSGLLFGIAAFSRPTVLAFIPFAALWLVLSSNTRFLTKIMRTALLISVIILAISPWAIRNYIIHKRVIIFSTQDTEVFWRSNNPNATGTSLKKDGTAVVASDKELYNKILSLNELDKRELFREEGIKFVKNNPGKFISLYLKKLRNFWWFSPASGVLYPRQYLILYKVYYIIILAFAVIGLINIFYAKNEAARRNTMLILLFALSICLFQSFFYVEGRHRWGIEPLLMIFSAIGIASFKKGINRENMPDMP